MTLYMADYECRNRYRAPLIRRILRLVLGWREEPRAIVGDW